jgi:spermidine/putrescine transport system permease protein
MWINSLLRTYAVKTVFDMFSMTNAYVNITIAMVYDFFPFMLLPIYTVLVSMDKSYLEAANDLGGGPLKTFLRVKLPLSTQGIISGILMVFMPTVSTFAIADIVADRTYLFGNLIDQYFQSRLFYNVGSAYALILLAAIAVTMFIANKLTGSKSGVKGGGAV